MQQVKKLLLKSGAIATIKTLKTYKLPHKLALLSCSALVALVIVECAGRLAGWGGVVLFTPNVHWGFLMQPSQIVYTYGVPVKINALGLRGPELQSPKRAGAIRIVFIGDSVTYGGGRIREQELFCRRVETSAQHHGFDVEAVNLAAPAWSPQNWWGYVQKRGLHDADIVVLVLPECDLARVFSKMELAGHSESASRFRLHSLAAKVISRFGHERLSARQRRDEVITANLNAIIGLKEKCKNITLLPVLIPSYVPSKPNDQLWSIFVPHLTDALDLRADLQSPTYFFDGSHLSVQGHEFVAAKLFAKLYDALATAGHPTLSVVRP
jgi:hypothetical protein